MLPHLNYIIGWFPCFQVTYHFKWIRLVSVRLSLPCINVAVRIKLTFFHPLGATQPLHRKIDQVYGRVPIRLYLKEEEEKNTRLLQSRMGSMSKNNGRKNRLT